MSGRVAESGRKRVPSLRASRGALTPKRRPGCARSPRGRGAAPPLPAVRKRSGAAIAATDERRRLLAGDERRVHVAVENFEGLPTLDAIARRL
eukprot:7379827-Prymnesium_polylepis.3